MSKTDSRTVATDALETLGTVIDETQKRDAIHLAVVPVKAITRVYPGQHVTAIGDPSPVFKSELVGIVDPFLTEPVFPDQWFWLVIYPRKITSLRHVWSHPSFPEEVKVIEPKMPTWPAAEKAESSFLGAGQLVDALNAHGASPWRSSRWLSCLDNGDKQEAARKIQEIADSIDIDVEELMAGAVDYLRSGDYIVDGDKYQDVYLDGEFWDYYEIVTGEKVPAGERGSFFSCSC